MGLTTSVELPADERFHRGALVEWWYAAALVDSSQTDEKFAVVASFTSYRETLRSKPGHMLIGGLARLPNRNLATLSVIDRDLRQAAFTNLRSAVRRGKSTDYAEAYLESLERASAPRPYLVSEDCAFGYDRLVARLGSSALEGKGGGRYAFRLEDCGAAADLEMRALKPAMLNGHRGRVKLGSLGMNYYSYPSVSVSGNLVADGLEHKVSGIGWIDHQWGDWFRVSDTLFRTEPMGPKRVGWQWFGIQLSNGVEVNAYLPSYALTGEPLPPSVTVSFRDGSFAAGTRVEAKAQGVWQSLRTLTTYPVGWTVRVPEFDLALDVTPQATMELPVFGPTLGVLEAPSTVRGVMKGRDVEGTCWAETLGDKFDEGDFWKAQKQCVNSELSKVIPLSPSEPWLERLAGPARWSREPSLVSETMTKPLWDLLERGGKRWRPIWMSLCCDSVGGDSEMFRSLLAIPELMHTGSLIVDDIEDGSDYRRGEQSLHIKYGVPVALNAGNMLYFLPLVLVEESGVLTSAQKHRIYACIASAGRRAHLGQAADIHLEASNIDFDSLLGGSSRIKDTLLQMYSDKTGSQARALAEIGGVMGNGTEGQIEALAEYSDAVGVAFQMINDVSNLQPHQKGKRGEDIRQGKLRFVTLEAIANARASDSRRLVQILKQRTRDRESVEEAIEIVIRSGGVEATKRKLRQMIDVTWERLSPLLEETEAKIMLKAGPRWLLKQDTLEAQL